MPRRSRGGGRAAWLLKGLAAGLVAGPCSAVRLAGSPKADEYGLKCKSYSWGNFQEDVTAIISASPRPEDATGMGLQVLRGTIASVINVLGLAPSQVIVAFDAVPNTTRTLSGDVVLDLSDDAEYHYKAKIAGVEGWNERDFGGAMAVWRNSQWTHQAEMDRRVLEHLQKTGKLTPMIYMAQDDAPVFGGVDVPFILSTISCDPKVDYVRFLWSEDCDMGPAEEWNVPCSRHPRTSLLHSVARYSDRPQFATADFYFRQVFSHIPRTDRKTPEQEIVHASHMWIYGERGHMRHEQNALRNSYNKRTDKNKQTNATESQT